MLVKFHGRGNAGGMGAVSESEELQVLAIVTGASTRLACRAC